MDAGAAQLKQAQRPGAEAFRKTVGRQGLAQRGFERRAVPRRHAGSVDQNAAGAIAQPDLPCRLAQGGGVQRLGGRTVGAGMAAGIDIDGGERMGGLDDQSAAALQGKAGGGQGFEFGLDLVIEGAGDEAGAEPGGLGCVIGDDLCLGVGGAQPHGRIRPALDQPRLGGGQGRRALDRDAWALRTLRRAGDAHHQQAAFLHHLAQRAAGEAGLGFWQKTGLAVGQGEKGPGHGGGDSGDMRGQDIAHAIGPRWALHPGLGHHIIEHEGHAPLARRTADADGRLDRAFGPCIGSDAHGRSHPTPRSNCAVSNSGRPTILDQEPDMKRTQASALPWMA